MDNDNLKNSIIQYQDNISKVEKYKKTQSKLITRFSFDKKVQKRFSDCADVLFFNELYIMFQIFFTFHKKFFEVFDLIVALYFFKTYYRLKFFLFNECLILNVKIEFSFYFLRF